MNSFLFISLEWKQMLRSKWLQLVTILFIFVFVAIVIIQQIALPDIKGFTRQTASLLNILLFLLPLFTLTIGSMTIAGDVESGWFSLLKTYPMSVMQYILGKYISLVFAFFVMLTFTLGVVFTLGGLIGGVIVPISFILIAISLILIFSSISLWIGCISKNRLQAMALSLVIWAVLLLLLSYLLMAVGTFIPGHVLQKLTIGLLHLNPVEWLRFCFLVLGGQASILGPSYFNIIHFYESSYGIWVMFGISMTWVIIPLLLTKQQLKKRGA